MITETPEILFVELNDPLSAFSKHAGNQFSFVVPCRIEPWDGFSGIFSKKVRSLHQHFQEFVEIAFEVLKFSYKINRVVHEGHLRLFVRVVRFAETEIKPALKVDRIKSEFIAEDQIAAPEIL
jgi:hypothetical protein